ncbi:MAG: CbtA family protein [Actinomycetota bacterium]|nr:CbtA family protein [Actinomycetota bacterium]
MRRGLAAGMLAGLLAGAFAFVFGEPLVQDAIDIENAASGHASVGFVALPAHVSDWVVSRPQQRGGLFLATALYGAAVGGLYAIAFAALRGRGAPRSDWQLATRLAGAIFVAMVLVPFLKYPANPPAVGDPNTIGARTEYFLVMLVGSLLAMLAAVRVWWSIGGRPAPWTRPLLAGATFIAVAGGLALALPGVQEIPKDFPAPLIWEFRVSALGTQAVLWAALGIAFGILSHRVTVRGAPV